MMEKLQKELDDVKDEMEKLTAEYRIKAELSESLKRTHNEQLIKLKEAKMEIEKQAQDINAKAEEISVTKQMYEDVKNSLNEKESVIRHLSSTNEKIRADFEEKMQKLERENRDMSVALEDVNVKSFDQEKIINKYKEEIENLKGCLTNSKKKCLEAEQRANASKEVRQRESMFIEVEEENGKLKDKLKWKIEQFKHLEEAHDKMQKQFDLSKKAWEKEKSTLIDEITSLQSSLDSQTRISESLKSRLEMCNQALAHEESRRKLLEVQISESKASYENVFADYEEAKSKIENLTVQRNEEIASLRNSLGSRQTLSKEMEFKIGHLEEENRELKESLKELREAQIQEAGAAGSLSKLRNKLKSIEKVHKECSANLKAKEIEWSTQVEKMSKDLSDCRDELDCKDKQLHEMQIELENCNSSILQLKLDYEEMSVLLMVYKSGYSDAHSDLSDSKVKTEMHNKETDEQVADLMEQLDRKNSSLVQAYNDIEKCRDSMSSLEKKIESLYTIEQQYLSMQNELEKCKAMLEESSLEYLNLKEQASHMESSLNEDLRKVSDALDVANQELAERANDESEIEFELDRWKSVAERLQACLEESQETRKEMEDSLLAQVEMEQTLKQEMESLTRKAEEKDKVVDELQKQVVLLEKERHRSERETILLERTAMSNDFEQERESILLTVGEKDKNIRSLKQDIAFLEEEFMARELEAAVLAQMKEERTLEQEKDQFTEHLNRSIMLIYEAWEKITTSWTLGELEIQLKSLTIIEMEEEIHNLQKNLELLEKSLSCSKQNEEHLKLKQLEIEQVIAQLENQGRTSKAVNENLESEKRLLLDEVMKLTSEKRDLLNYVGEFSDQVNEFSDKDTALMGKLEKIVQSFNRENKLVTDLVVVDDKLYDLNAENVSPLLASLRKKNGGKLEERSPLRERNISHC